MNIAVKTRSIYLNSELQELFFAINIKISPLMEDYKYRAGFVKSVRVSLSVRQRRDYFVTRLWLPPTLSSSGLTGGSRKIKELIPRLFATGRRGDLGFCKEIMNLLSTIALTTKVTL